MTRRQPSKGRRVEQRKAERAEREQRLGPRPPRPQPENPRPNVDKKEER